jgi:hypothetical protein
MQTPGPGPCLQVSANRAGLAFRDGVRLISRTARATGLDVKLSAGLARWLALRAVHDREQGAAAQQVGAGASVYLALEHLARSTLLGLATGSVLVASTIAPQIGLGAILAGAAAAIPAARARLASRQTAAYAFWMGRPR